jgi:hypothetical protein
MHEFFTFISHVVSLQFKQPLFFLGVYKKYLKSEPIRQTINLNQREEREENREWITKREMIASTIWNDYNTQKTSI